MARSTGRVAVAAILGALCYPLWTELAAFVSPAAAPLRASGRRLGSRVSLAAAQADLVAAKQELELKRWAAEHLAAEGSADAAAASARARQAEEAYEALKAQEDGQAPPSAAAPAASARMPAAPVAAATATAARAGAVSKADIEEAKAKAQLLLWAAQNLAKEASPHAAAMKVKADQAIAAFDALVQAQAGGVAAPARAAPAPAEPSAAGPSGGEVPEARREEQLHGWVQKMLGSSSPTTMEEVGKASHAARLDAEEDFFKAKKEMKLYEWAEKMLAASESLESAKAMARRKRETYEAMERVLKAKKEMELHDWAARMLASSDSLHEAKAKADEKRQTYETVKATEEQHIMAR